MTQPPIEPPSPRERRQSEPRSAEAFATDPLPVGLLVHLLFRRWMLVLGALVLGAALGWGSTAIVTPTYTAQSVQLVKGIPGAGVAANYEAAQYAVRRAKSYPAFVYSQAVLEGVRADMGGETTIDALRGQLSAANPADTPLVQVEATGSTPEIARDVSNSAARHLARFITQIETVSGRSPVAVETVVQAVTPTRPTSPKPAVTATLGAMVAFALALLLALVLEYRPRERGAAGTALTSEEPATPSPFDEGEKGRWHDRDG